MWQQNDTANVGLVTGRKAGHPRNSGSNLETEKNFLLLHSDLTVSGSYVMGKWGKASGGVKLTDSPTSTAEVKYSLLYASTHPYAFMASTRTTLYIYRV